MPPAHAKPGFILPPHPRISTPVTLPTAYPTAAGPGAWELKPTRSQTTGELFAISGTGAGLNGTAPGCGNTYLVSKFSRMTNTSTSDLNSGFYQGVPHGDTWSTSSGYSGLEFLDFIYAPYLNTYDQATAFNNAVLLPFLSSISCNFPVGLSGCPSGYALQPNNTCNANPIRSVGIGDTTAANILSPNLWEAPVYTWMRPEAGDGQNSYADPGGTALFVAAGAGATEGSRVTGTEIPTTPSGSSPAGDTYKGGGGRALFVAPNCAGLPKLNANPALVKANEGFASSPSCVFKLFGGSYISPHDKLLLTLPQYQGKSPDTSSYSYIDATADDPTPGGAVSHVTVDANPCTHNAIVAYVAGSGEVHVKFVTPDGVVAGKILVDRYPSFSDVATLAGLSRYVLRVALATATDGKDSPLGRARCYLYTAYDFMDLASLLVTVPRVYAKMSVWDITSENPGQWNPVQVFAADNMDTGILAKCKIIAKGISDLESAVQGFQAQIDSKGPDGRFPDAYQKSFTISQIKNAQDSISQDTAKLTACVKSARRLSWHSTVTASAFSPNIGWFFYDDQANGGKNTIFHAWLDGDFAKAGMKDVGAISTTPIMGDPGGGDYIAALTGGDVGGYLVPTWAQGGQILASWVLP